MKTNAQHLQHTALVGPQGCGKSYEARVLARLTGNFVELETGDADGRALSEALLSRPANCIIHEPDAELLSRLKAMISAGSTRVRLPFSKQSVKILTPRFIVCSSDPSLFAGSRRFHVVHIPSRQGAAQ